MKKEKSRASTGDNPQPLSLYRVERRFYGQRRPREVVRALMKAHP